MSVSKAYASIPDVFFEHLGIFALQNPIVGGICYLLICLAFPLSPILAFAAFYVRQSNKKVRSSFESDIGS